MPLRRSFHALLPLLVASPLVAQAPSALWAGATEGNWIEGCGTLVIHRDLDDGFWSDYRPDPRCPMHIAAERLVGLRRGIGVYGGSQVVRQSFIVYSSAAYHLPAWFVAGAPQVYVEGHRVIVRTEDDATRYPASYERCDSLRCQAEVGPDDLAWQGMDRESWYGRVPRSGESSVVLASNRSNAEFPRFEIRLTVPWRPDSVIIPISFRAVLAGSAPAAPVPADERTSVPARGLRGSIRTDLVAVLPSPRQGAGRRELLSDLCGARPVITPAWALIPQGAFVLQDLRTDGARDLLACVRQDRAAESWNLWRPDPGQRLLDPSRISGAPTTSDPMWMRSADLSAVERDLPVPVLISLAGALGVDSLWRSETSAFFWYLIRAPGLDRDAWPIVGPQLDRIAGSGIIGPTPQVPGGPTPDRILPESAWHVSREAADLIRRTIRGPIRNVTEYPALTDTTVVGITVAYGDSTICIDMSCRYPMATGLRIGGRVGWFRTPAFLGRWPEDTALLARLERMAERNELDYPFRPVLVDLRLGLVNAPRATPAWRHRLVVAHRTGGLGEVVDSALCARAVREGEFTTLLDLATRGTFRPLRCAEEALTAARGELLRRGRLPSELLLYYAARGNYLAKDTIAHIAWRAQDWAVLGASGPPREFFGWADTLKRVLRLPPEAGVEACFGTDPQRWPYDGCVALTGYALRSGDRRLLLYLANRGPGATPGEMANWMRVNRFLRGEPLRARWVRTWVDD